ncbi:hypothetical protein AVEN_29684-1 [Araneus ventricosus]|uniref:Uncharacterized protein n=1 Tax=Araneus ventricosus TaxID=182803 RepID=A0A4Y2TRZ9_ARAVE|nr:hypothetical protein AVEN_2029-1 [Araneus ventricosus]GBO02167.1 hypothetical protein AVEN_29684-1 [Araneus ventricosus]
MFFSVLKPQSDKHRLEMLEHVHRLMRRPLVYILRTVSASVLNGRIMDASEKEDDYTRLSIDKYNHEDYSDEDLFKILYPEKFARADDNIHNGPLMKRPLKSVVEFLT